MTHSRARRPTSVPRKARLAILAALVALPALLPAVALAAAKHAAAKPQTTKVVRYDGVHVTVPAGWPVFHLGASSHVCVRFDRHAVYLGEPGAQQSCPMQPVGRTEAILISPAARGDATDVAGRGLLTPVSTAAAAPGGGTMARIADKRHHVVITATWNSDPGTIRRALDLSSLARAIRATNGHRPAPARVGARRPRALPRETSPAAPAIPGAVFNGLGFDACSAPSATSMSAWSTASPYGALGIYIGGADAACSQPNLTAAWVSAESAAGWHMIPTYVGLQAPGNSCGCKAMSSTPATAATQGTAAAEDAVAQAQALGIGPGNPIYFDMEPYTRNTTDSSAALAFLQAWTQQLHLSSYISGVYGSGTADITDLVSKVGTGYLEPDDLWVADWSSSSTYVPANADNPYVPSTDWAANQRLLQYYGGHNVKYGGVTINIDSDYLDGATAAYGSGTPVALVSSTPSVQIQPQADGSVRVTPTWAGELGVTKFRILGGSSATAMAPVATLSADRATGITLHDVYPYFEAQGLNSLGQVVGTSPAAQTPASVAIYGNSAFVGSRGSVGVPVACLNTAPCQVTAAIYEGNRRLAQTVATETISPHGGLVFVPLSTQVHRLVAHAVGRRLPAKVTVTASSGAKATRTLNLIPYTASGREPALKTWASASVQILSKTNFVAGGWVGGILTACKAAMPCVVTTKVTRGGVAIATAKTQTLGAGEVGYLTFTLDKQAHALLEARKGNQLGARVTISTASPSLTGGAAAESAPATAMALVSLDSFR